MKTISPPYVNKKELTFCKKKTPKYRGFFFFSILY